ncbi:MAG: hypothetical protein B6U87_01750 [Candidatus Aenigmarchaeota archaeon ex4484_52]|nr:MAG: hypothetical protein B6U87_01750 [Candidatus Aenigmarchaeota archaeon ex4484_52]
MVFYVALYGAIISASNSFTNIPYFGYIILILSLIIIQPFDTIFFTDIYFNIQKKYLKDKEILYQNRQTQINISRQQEMNLS